VFRVVLPSSGGAASALSDEPPASFHAHGGALGARVLIVDDDVAVGTSLRRVLHGECVTLVRSGREALELLEQEPQFDVIVCDLMMPELTGWELHGEVSRRWPEQGARMVFLTGGAFTEAARAFFETVANPCLEKPVDVARLRSIVRAMAATSRPGAPARR
jgi:CheY-like chemotaxis protein